MSDSSRKGSIGSQRLFGRVRLPKFNNRVEIADISHKTMEQLTNLASMFRRTDSVNAEKVPSNNHDLRSMGYEKSDLSDDKQIFINETSVSEMFSEKQIIFAEEHDRVQDDFVVPAVPSVQEEQVAEISVEDDIVEMQEMHDFHEIPEVEKIAEDDLVKRVVASDPSECEDMISESTHISIEDLFTNVPRGNEGVNTEVGVFDNGTVKSSEEYRVMERLDDFVSEPAKASTGLMERDIFADDEFTYAAPVMEREMIGSAPSVPEEEDDVPEVFVPKVEDIAEEAVAEAPAEDTVLMLSAPAEVLAIPAPVAQAYAWDVDEETSYSFTSFQSIEPDYAAYGVYEPIAEVPWTLSDEAVAAYGAYMSIEPKYETKEVSWELSEDAVAAYGAFLSIRPQYEVPVVTWEVSDEAAESYGAFMSIEPEYPVQESSWEVSDEAADAFNGFMSIRPEYPVVVAKLPEWDLTEEASVAVNDYQAMEEEYFREAFVASLPGTISSNRIEVEPLESHIGGFDALAMDSTPAYAETSTEDAGVSAEILADESVVKSNIEIVPEKKIENGREVRASRFVFKDGRLQKIQVNAPETEKQESFDYTPAPVTKEETFRTPLTIEEEIAKPTEAKMVARQVEGVSFDFGQSSNNSGKIRFQF